MQLTVGDDTTVVVFGGVSGLVRQDDFLALGCLGSCHYQYATGLSAVNPNGLSVVFIIADHGSVELDCAEKVRMVRNFVLAF